MPVGGRKDPGRNGGADRQSAPMDQDGPRASAAWILIGRDKTMAGFISSSAFSTIAGLMSLLSGFISSIIVARLLGPEGTGEVTFALFVVTTGAIVTALGVPNVLLRYIQTYDRPGNPGGGLTRRLAPYFALPTALSVLGLLAYAAWLQASGAKTDHMPSTWVMTAVLFLIYMLAAVTDSVSRGLNRFAETTKYIFFGCLLQIPLIAIGGYFYGVAGALVGHVGRHLPQALRLYQYASRKPAPEVVITGKMREFGRNSWISSVIGLFIWTRVELFFLGFYFATTEIGHYAAGLTLAGLVVQLPAQMLGAMTPHLGRHHDNGDRPRVRRTYHRIMRWLALLVLPICFGGAAIMGTLLPLLFGEEFREAVPMAQVLLAFACLTAFSGVPSGVIGACERSDFFLRASPVIAILSLAIFAVTVPWGGGLAAAWARAAVHGVWLVWLAVFCWRQLAVPLNLVDLLLIAFAALLCSLSAYAVLVEVGGFGGLMLAVSAGALTYVLALRVLRVIPRDDVEALVSNLPGRMPERLAHYIYHAMTLLVATPARSKS